MTALLTNHFTAEVGGFYQCTADENSVNATLPDATAPVNGASTSVGQKFWVLVVGVQPRGVGLIPIDGQAVNGFTLPSTPGMRKGLYEFTSDGDNWWASRQSLPFGPPGSY